MSGTIHNKLIRIILFVVIILSSVNCLFSQVAVEKSKDKVVIAGVTYYIHQVKKGETAYSIAKAYGVTVEDITRENPPAVYGINAGQTLRIPFKPAGDVAPVQSAATGEKHDDSKYIYHVLKAGETIYFLSKTYGVSENDIISSNPGIDITKLSVGMGIIVPRKEFMTSQQTFDATSRSQTADQKKADSQVQSAQKPVGQPVTQAAVITQAEPQMMPQEKGFFYHKVQSGESLSSIADLYGVTVRELRKVNKDLRFPQVGDYVKVPGNKEPEKPQVTQAARDTVIREPEAPAAVIEKPAGFTAVTGLSGSLDIAVLLPFYLPENAVRTEIDSSKGAKGKTTIKTIQRNEDWIYPRSVDFIEMYNGILLAADTLRALGININLHTFDIKGDSTELQRLIRGGKLSGMDLIIGPVYSANLSIVASYARDLGIPVVSPVPLYNDSVLKDNPNLFLASSTLEIAQQTLARKMAQYSDNNFIFLSADSLGVDADVERFRKLILSELGKKIPYEDIKFREFMFYSRSMFDNDSINRLEHALSDKSGNIIVIASEDPPVISETMIDVHSLSKRFDVKVFGYPVLRDMENLDPKYFFDLDLMVYSPYWLDYSKSNVMRFNSQFRQKFLTEPTEKSYAWMGYDIAYYFISGLAMHGKEFIRHPQMHHPDLLQTDFDFRSDSENDGFENNNLFLIRYTKDYEVRLVEGDVPFTLK